MFNLHHVPDVNNEVADFLSRNPAAEMDDSEMDQPLEVCRDLAGLTITDTVQDDHEEAEEGIMVGSLSWETDAIPADVYEKIQTCHNISVGHHGRDATIAKLL